MTPFITGLVTELLNLFTESSLYLLFGFFIAGLIHVWFPEGRISRYFGGNSFRSVFNASLLGIPLPLCSCAVVPTAIALRKSGASRGATLSFLVSTPETGVDSLGISFALLDPLLAIFRPISAFVTALVTGLGVNLVEKHSRNEKTTIAASEAITTDSCCVDGCQASNSHRKTSSSFKQKLKDSVKYAFSELIDDLALWLLIGFVAAALIAVFIPDNFFVGGVGGGILPMLLMLLVGIPLYLCATASTPIAAVLILKGLSPGAALVFMLAGPATNIGALILLSRYFEKKYLAIYLLTIALVSLLLGMLLNSIYMVFELNPRASLGVGGELWPKWLEISAASVFTLLLVRSLFRTYRRKKR